MHPVHYPYPGLRPFDRDEEFIFFGREEQTDQLLEKLMRTRFLAVVGASGFGKSSLVRAGMIPALETGFMVSAGSCWRVVVMRPGAEPLYNLVQGLIEAQGGEERDVAPLFLAGLRRGPLGLVEILSESLLVPGENFLLIVDQFEEIFRFQHLSDRDETSAFVALLLASASQQQIPVYVVLTMRSDFLGDCARFNGLSEALNESLFLIPRLSREHCRVAIEGPALVYSGRVESVLIAHLLNEMGADPDALPLMQQVLARLWSRAVASADIVGEIMLKVSDYEAIGGSTGALSYHADEVYHKLEPYQQRIAEVLFRCLSEVEPGKFRGTRRPTCLGEVAKVAGETIERVAEVVEVFRAPDANFLSPPCEVFLDSDTVLDISYESLIRQWERLRMWTVQEAESVRMYRRLEETARLWVGEQAVLLCSPELDFTLQWRDTEVPNLSWAARYGSDFDLAMRFLDMSEQKHRKRVKQLRVRLVVWRRHLRAILGLQWRA